MSVRNKWLDDEINLIYSNYKNMNDEELHKIIPNHSVSSIATKRKDLHLTKPQGGKKYTYNDVILEMNKRGYILLSRENDFKNASSILKYRCPYHNKCIQETTLGRLLEGKGCIYCGREKTIKSRTTNKEQCIDLCNECNLEYVDHKILYGKTYVYYICPNHIDVGIQKASFHNIKRDGCGCKYCRSNNKVVSKGELKIKEFLSKINIPYIRQYRFDGCADQLNLPFDFYLPNNNLIIEYDGQHHFYPITFNSISIEKAKNLYYKTAMHDDIKNEYCKKHKIKLLRIPYWDFENIDYILFDTLEKYNIIERVS